MEAGVYELRLARQFWMFQFKSNILAPFSAQKLSNCLATVDEAAQKAL